MISAGNGTKEADGVGTLYSSGSAGGDNARPGAKASAAISRLSCCPRLGSSRSGPVHHAQPPWPTASTASTQPIPTRFPRWGFAIVLPRSASRAHGYHPQCRVLLCMQLCRVRRKELLILGQRSHRLRVVIKRR